MKHTLLLSLAFGGLLVSPAAAQSPPSITNGALTLEYQTDPDVGLVPLSFSYAGQADPFVLHRPSWSTEGIWEIELCDPNTNPREIITINPEDPLCTFNFRTLGSWPPNVVHATWTRIQYPGVTGNLSVTVHASIPPGSDVVRFEIDVVNRTTSHSTYATNFPRLRIESFGQTGDDEVLSLANAGGFLVYNPIESEFVNFPDYGTGAPGSEWYMLPLRHPTGKFTQQMWAWYDGSLEHPDVLFGGTRDTSWTIKDFLFDAGHEQDPGYLTTSVRTVLPDNLTIGNDQPSLFPYVLSAFAAGASDAWYDAARFYREWAVENLLEPEIKDPIQYREGFSDIIRDAKMFSTFSAPDPSDFQYWSRDIVDQRTWFDVEDLPGNVYHWHHNLFGEDWGDWWPPRDEFLTEVPAIAWLQHGFAPYILMNAYDYTVPSFDNPYVPGYDESLLQWVVKDLDGNYVKPLINGDAYTLCLASPFARDYLKYCLMRLASSGESDALGTYLDVWGGSSVHTCYATNHGHAPGGGSYWIQAMRSSLQEAVALVRELPGKEEFFITTEAQNEAFVGLIESSYINYNYPYDLALRTYGEGAPAPIVTATYNDRMKHCAPTTAHVQEIYPDEIYQVIRRWIASMVFFGYLPPAGSVLGPVTIHDNMTASPNGYAPYMEMLQRFMDVLEEDGVRDCVHFGERLRDPVTDASLIDALDDDFMMPYDNDSQPVVYTACFRDQTKTSFGLLFTNWTETGEVFTAGSGLVRGGDQIVQYTFNTDEYLEAGNYLVHTFTPGGIGVSTRALTSTYTTTQEVPEKSAVFVLFEKL